MSPPGRRRERPEGECTDFLYMERVNVSEHVRADAVRAPVVKTSWSFSRLDKIR